MLCIGIRFANLYLQCNVICGTITAGGDIMEKTATINVRVDPEVKRSAEAILKRIGLPISTAIDIYLNKIIMTGGIPFALTTPMSPPELNMDLMTEEELISAIEKGRKSIAEGRSRKAREVFDEFMERQGNGNV